MRKCNFCIISDLQVYTYMCFVNNSALILTYYEKLLLHTLIKIFLHKSNKTNVPVQYLLTITLYKNSKIASDSSIQLIDANIFCQCLNMS